MTGRREVGKSLGKVVQFVLTPDATDSVVDGDCEASSRRHLVGPGLRAGAGSARRPLRPLRRRPADLHGTGLARGQVALFTGERQT